jgi:hypothetical protein
MQMPMAMALAKAIFAILIELSDFECPSRARDYHRIGSRKEHEKLKLQG